MTVGIIGSGIAGLHLALALEQRGIAATIYSERTPEAELGRQLPNMVARNACTRARERALAISYWDAASYDMGRLAVSIRGKTPLAFSGRMAPAQAVDMRMYCARLQDEFSSRGGQVVVRTVHPRQLDGLASQHRLLVVASGRASLSTIFPRVAEHSPYTRPERLVVVGLFRGVRYSEPRALEVIATPGSGEVLVVPFQSFEPDLTGIGILIAEGGLFEPLRHRRYDDDRRAYIAGVLDLLREHAPSIHDRIEPREFDLARPQDLGYAAITPTVRRGFIELSSGRHVIALGDAHVVIDPITGQGANSAVHAAAVLARAIADAHVFDRQFCQRVEQEICSYVVPVSDAANARLRPPAEHFRALLGAAARDQAIADTYAEGYNYPDQFWGIASSPERTAALLSAPTA